LEKLKKGGGIKRPTEIKRMGGGTGRLHPKKGTNLLPVKRRRTKQGSNQLLKRRCKMAIKFTGGERERKKRHGRPKAHWGGGGGGCPHLKKNFDVTKERV